MSNEKIGMNEEDVSSILGKIDALLSVSQQGDDIAAQSLPLFHAKKDSGTEEFGEAQEQEIAKGMARKLPVEIYSKQCFNWMQMYEIRLGLLDGLDAEQYANPLFSANQMREIRLGMLDHLDVSSYTKLVLSATDMRGIRKTLFAKAYKEKSNHIEKKTTDDETGIALRISDDSMKAYMKIPKLLKQSLTKYDLIHILKEHDITYGIKDNTLDILLKEEMRDHELCVAEGKPPVHGKSAWYELFFNNAIENSHYLPPNREIDYSSVNTLESVSPNMPLAKYHPAEVNTNGITVTDMDVEGNAGENLPPLNGSGIRYDEKTQTYYATEKGFPSYSKITNSLNVWNVYNLSGDVSYLQSISFDGIVHVSGSVQNLAVIRATGDIIVDGFVESAHLLSDQNIIIKGGVNGTEQGFIKAGGFVHGKFFENATIQCNGNVEGNYFLNCKITTDSGVLARGKKSRIMGGDIKASYCVEAAVVGNYLSQKTFFQIGDLIDIEERIYNIRQEKEKVNDALQELLLGKQKLILLLGEDSAEKNPLYKKTCDAIYTEETQIEKYDKELTRLQTVWRRAQKAYFKIQGQLQDGVVISINGVKKIIRQPVQKGILLTKQAILKK